ncbi:MAG: hypothetical protein M3405_06075 [Acidobacteriota bacterium]|jgi:hypothetical protein|nr:hypothetical protein [Acidobacteriota bacterium]
MTKETLTKYWNELIPNFLPIAHELKNQFNERWFRIHTLPESKQYPDNESEYAEILKRHILILSDLMEENHSLILVSFGYGLNEKFIEKNNQFVNLGFQENFWMSINVSDESDEESYFWNVFYDEIKFCENSLNNLFRLIADEEIENIILFSIEKNFVYHPYDGGADIILENSNLRDKYKDKYKDWLSNHPKGL